MLLLLFFSKDLSACAVTERETNTTATINATREFDFVFILNKMNGALA